MFIKQCWRDVTVVSVFVWDAEIQTQRLSGALHPVITDKMGICGVTEIINLFMKEEILLFRFP
jgi:hypothetical protein